MPNIDSVFKQEVARLSRKELKAETQPLKKAASGYRSEIASLKRRVDALERHVRRMGKRRAQAEAKPNGDETSTRHRFSAQRLAAHREKLGLSAADYGKLIGASTLSVYKWESGKARPRAKSLAAIAGVRNLGKREAAKRLEELA